MIAGKDDIRRWFEKGAEEGRAYMLVVYDKMDFDDFPIYKDSETAAHKAISAYRHDSLSKVMEVYDLKQNMEKQLAEKRAWNLPARQPEQDVSFPASEPLPSGETRLEFMKAKNAEYIKEHFGGAGSVVPYAARVFTDNSHEHIHAVCAYILERGGRADKTMATVYRFGADGGAKAYDVLLMDMPEEGHGKAVNFPLTQYYRVAVDEPYITFNLRYAIGKDLYSPAYKQWSLTNTCVFMEDYDSYGSDSGSSGFYVDYESYKGYELSTELLKNGGTRDEALELLRKAADEGCADAAFKLGTFYNDRANAERDKKEASHWFERASLLGHAEA